MVNGNRNERREVAKIAKFIASSTGVSIITSARPQRPLAVKKNHSFTTLMALKRYAQTTSGYARVLQLTPEAIQRLAQKKMGREVRLGLSGKR